MLSFSQAFSMTLGIMAAALIGLLCYRIIESTFYFIGYRFGEAKAKEARLRDLESKEAAGLKATVSTSGK